MSLNDWLTPCDEEQTRRPLTRPQHIVTDEPRRWIETLFEPGDVLEVRCLPPKQLAEAQRPLEYRWTQTRFQHGFFPWVFANEIELMVNRLAEFNSKAATWWGVWHRRSMVWSDVTALSDVPLNIYASANPRIARGCTKSNDVILARSLFADLENISAEDALGKVAAAGLPRPTMIVVSGHGVHLYWRLMAPITNLGLWTSIQKRLIALLGSDGSIHDPARMMRLPGFMNVNGTPAPCFIYEADPGRRCDVKEIAPLLPPPDEEKHQTSTRRSCDGRPTGNSDTTPQRRNNLLHRAEAYAACFEPAEEGNRNNQILSRACNLVEKFDLTESESQHVIEQYNARFAEPLDQSEVEETVSKAFERVHKNGKPRGSLLKERVRLVSYEEPTGPVIELDDWRQQMAMGRIESLNESGKVFFDGSTTGAGKSTADLAAMQIAGASVTFLPTHDACDELVSSLVAKGLSAAAHPPLDKSTCKKFGTKSDPGPAQLAQKAGLNVGECVCPGCDVAKSCEYQRRRGAARSADHAVATHARAATSDFQPAKGKPVVFVHEDALNLLRPMAKVVRQSKKPETTSARHLREIVQIAKTAEEIAVTWPDKQLLAFCQHLQAATNELVNELEGDDLIGPILAAAQSGKPTKGLPTVKELVIPPHRDRLSGLDYLLQRAMERSGIQANGTALKLALAYATGELAGLCAVVDETFAKGGQPNFSKALVGVWNVQLPSDTVLWFENASSDARLLEALTGQKVIDKTPKGRLAYEVPPIQYADQDITQHTSGKTIRGIVRGLLARYSSATKVGIITHQCHVAEIESLAPLWSSRITKLEYFHSGKDRASNAWLDCDLILVLGTPRIPPVAVRDTLIRLGRINAASRNGEFGKILWEGRTSGGMSVRCQGLGYAEPSWAEVQQILVKETLRQAVGRGRGVTKKGVPVVVVSNEPLGLTLADDSLPLVSDTEDETLQLAVSASARNAKDITLGKRAVAPFTTGEVTAISRYETRAVRQHLASLTTHGLLQKKGERKGWMLADSVITHLTVNSGM